VSGKPQDAEILREETWIIAGDPQHSAMLVAFKCPRCEHKINVND